MAEEKRGLDLSLKGALCAGLGWLVPGAGHLLLGRRFKAGLFFAVIVGCYLLGLLVSRGTCISKHSHPYSYWAQLGVGGPTFLLASMENPPTPLAPGYRQESISSGIRVAETGPYRCVRCGDHIDLTTGEPLPECTVCSGRTFKYVVHPFVAGLDLGLLYTMVAGLLNILVAADAYDQAR